MAEILMTEKLTTEKLTTEMLTTKKRDLLFEIGTEEIPARFLPGAIKQMEDLAKAALKENSLNFEGLRVLATPRRLALLVFALDTMQPDTASLQKGPALKAAYAKDGKATKALEGFCKGQGVQEEDLLQKEVNGNIYLYANKQQKGKEAREILPDILFKIINKLYFPKPMRWAYEEMRFARPIRWMAALWGEEILPLTIAGIKAGNLSRGHRVLGSQEIKIPSPRQYEELLLKNWVMADQNKRRREVWRQAVELAGALGGKIEEDKELLEEVVYLIEYPTALAGSFEEKYLAIPQELIITPMKEHQRYFPVYNEDGELLNKFITVRNGDNRFLDIVASGNEKVLRARLADAEFFWLEDIKEPLSLWTEKLFTIVFHEKLGTLGHKAARTRKLGAYLAEALGYDTIQLNKTDRAIFLMKADLLSRVVYEFPELQGIMGEYYAKKDGEDTEIARAIREHYLPRFAGDSLPQTKGGKVASIVEKADSIIGFFALGIQPTGSQDPYALRRAATGIVQIILENGLDISLSALIAKGYELYKGDGLELKEGLEETISSVTAFLGQRLENILQEKGIDYDILNAVAAAGYDNLYLAYERAKALADYSAEDGFAQALAGFTRAANIVKKSPFRGGAVKESLLLDDAEKALFLSLKKAGAEVDKALKNRNYQKALEEIAGLRGDIDNFFTEVMVMAEEEELKNNRLALLSEIVALTRDIGDLSQIVIK